MISIIVVFIIRVFCSAFCLWAGMKLTKVDGAFLAMLLISAISNFLVLVPIVGWIIGTVTMFVLICKWTDANFWPDAVLMVVVAEAVSILLGGILTNI